MLVFGGRDTPTSTPALEVWQYYRVNNAWQTKWTDQGGSGTVPPALYMHAAVYVNNLVFFIGGLEEAGFFAQLWSFSVLNNEWADLTDTNTPIMRGHSAVWDPDNTAVLIFGGYHSIEAVVSLTNTISYYQDFSGSYYWISPEQPSSSPSARSRHVAVYDDAHGVMLVHGGEDDAGNYFSDTWEYHFSGNYWIEETRPSEVPQARARHTAVFDGYCMLITGGVSAAGKLEDLWQYCQSDGS